MINKIIIYFAILLPSMAVGCSLPELNARFGVLVDKLESINNRNPNLLYLSKQNILIEVSSLSLNIIGYSDHDNRLIQNDLNKCKKSWETEIQTKLINAFSNKYNIVNLSDESLNKFKELVNKTMGGLDPETAPNFRLQFPEYYIKLSISINIDRKISPYITHDLVVSGSIYEPETGNDLLITPIQFKEKVPEFGAHFGFEVSRYRNNRILLDIHSNNTSQRIYCHGSPTAAFFIGGTLFGDTVDITDIQRPNNSRCLRPGESLRPREISTVLAPPNSNRIVVCYSPFITHDELASIIENGNEIYFNEQLHEYKLADYGIACLIYRK